MSTVVNFPLFRFSRLEYRVHEWTVSILFIFRRLVFFRHIRSRERILFGRLSERGCLPRALESTGNDFLANFQRVRRLIFSLRAIRLQRIISVDTPFSPPFSFHLFLFSFLFFSAQRFYRKTFSPFQSTARDHPLSRSKIFSYSATKLFSHMAQYQYALRYLLQFSFKQCFRVLWIKIYRIKHSIRQIVDSAARSWRSREGEKGRENLLPPMTKPIVPANHGFLNGSRRNKYPRPSLNQVSLKVIAPRIAVTSPTREKTYILYYRAAKSHRVFRSKIRENQKLRARFLFQFGLRVKLYALQRNIRVTWIGY